MIAGGAASAANAADVQDTVDAIEFFCENSADDSTEEICDDFEQLRNSMAAAAVSSVIRYKLVTSSTLNTCDTHLTRV